MSRELKTPQDSQTQQDVKDASNAPSAGVGRRPYTAPRLKRLGSVRDLTLGSPAQPFSDFMGGFQMAPM